MRPKTNRELEGRCIDCIRILFADAVQNANSGHPGMPMAPVFRPLVASQSGLVAHRSRPSCRRSICIA